ncbi:hypothetical protein ACQP2F_29250 [Actinoplanes sp. CA-030573]|uniref:hypothetical protein n=1 Tax=Actinoplanes sp. CA-030573 TaxID=3239898 RepID=UPI003D94E525
MRHLAARIATALALGAASLASAAPASAAVDGFAVKFGQSPATFTIGKDASTLTAVASTDRQRRCFRVRWSLTIRTEGVSLDQVRVNRVENGQSFPVRAQLGEEAARITDVQPDPGPLCRDQTVTGRWDISFTGPDNGEVTFEARALDVGGRELAASTAGSRVVTPVAARPSRSPSESPSPSRTPDEEATEEVAGDTAPQADRTTAAALNPAAGTPSVLGPGLIIGAVLVFLGVALLLRIRSRNRRDGRGDQPAWQTETQTLPTGFYNMPDRRRRR